MTIAAEAVALELKALGASHFFLVTGGDNALWIALRRCGIPQVLARSESSAVYMADGYARITGRPTFVYGQYGPGAANLAGALAEPYWSSSPVVAMPTSMRRQNRHSWEYQELEQLQVFAGVTKWQAEAQVPERMPHLVRAGALQAVSARPGPVYIGMPSDALEIEIPGYEAEGDASDVVVPWQRPEPSPDLMAKARSRIKSAHRPVLLVGNGVHASRAYEALGRAADALGIPIATSLSGKGAIADTADCVIGTIGRYSRSYANAIAREADLVIAVGSRLGGLVTDANRIFGEHQSVIQVDADPGAFRADLPGALFIQSDARAFLDELAATTPSFSERPGWAPWRQHAQGQAAAWRERFARASRPGEPGRPMRPELVLGLINRLAPADATVVADTGYAGAWAGAMLDAKQAGHQFLHADGSLGWAFPAALGVQLALPERPVIVVIGDGGIGYHLGEIETALRLDLPVVVIVLNNGSLAFEYHVQSLLYDEVVPEVDDFRDVDYGAVARAFGADGARVRNSTDLEAALRSALRRERLTVIDAVVDRDAVAPVTRYEKVRPRDL